MKHTLTLAAWNFRLARRSLLALWGIFAAQQLALVVFRICWQGAAGMGLASHYYVTMQIFAYLGFYLLTGLAAGLATHNSRRARSGYTWATLPGTPGQKFGAKAITIAAAEVVFTAWQFVWYIVEFYPVTALEVHLGRKLYGAALPPANLYEQVVANNLFSRLLPRRPLQLVILLGTLALSALLLAALDTVRGWRKLPVFKPENLEHENMWIMKEAQCLRDSAFSFCKARSKGQHIYEAGSIDTLVRIVDNNGGFTIIPELHLAFLSEA